MYLLKKYSLFESIQQWDKAVKNEYDEISHSHYNPEESLKKLRDEAIEGGLQNYLGAYSKIIINHIVVNDEFPTNIIENLEKIKKNKLKLDPDNMQDFSRHSLEEKVFNVHKARFVNKWCPAGLRKEAMDPKSRGGYRMRIQGIVLRELTSDEKDILRRGSRSKTAEDWWNIVERLNSKVNTEAIKNGNIKLFFEDDEWIIYKPLDYKSYLISCSPAWCTTGSESQFNMYDKWDLILSINKKKGINSSYISFGGEPRLFKANNRQVYGDLEGDDKKIMDLVKKYHSVKNIRKLK